MLGHSAVSTHTLLNTFVCVYVCAHKVGLSMFLSHTAMKNLLLHCNDLVTDDIISRLLTPLACAVALLTKSVLDWLRMRRAYGVDTINNLLLLLIKKIHMLMLVH